jgi:hypothetical protein
MREGVYNALRNLGPEWQDKARWENEMKSESEKQESGPAPNQTGVFCGTCIDRRDCKQTHTIGDRVVVALVKSLDLCLNLDFQVRAEFIRRRVVTQSHERETSRWAREAMQEIATKVGLK